MDDAWALRLGVFVAVLCAMALWELAAPCRRAEVPRLLRWTNHLALVALDSVLVRLLFPLTAAALALQVQTAGWGLFALAAWPGWVEGVVTFVLLDLAIYGQHRLFHAVPVLWRLHRVHHADVDFDVTTGIRFHPVEILLSMAIKLGIVALLGPPALAVLLFEVVLNASSLFNHANLRLPSRLDAILRRVIVTPDMHRIHHSVLRAETDSNFGFTLPWWDWLFHSYRSQPKDGHQDMVIGQPAFRSGLDQRLDRLLTQPLRRG